MVFSKPATLVLILFIDILISPRLASNVDLISFLLLFGTVTKNQDEKIALLEHNLEAAKDLLSYSSCSVQECSMEFSQRPSFNK